MKIAAIIVAAGSGARMGGALPKQYRKLAGRAVLQRSIDAFLALPEIDAIICVIGPDQTELYSTAVNPSDRLLAPVQGGATRQASVKAGLDALATDLPDLVLVHDAARPFVSPAIIRDVIAAIEPGTGALPGIPTTDTLARVAEGQHDGTVDRQHLQAMQTPQGFRYSELAALHAAAEEGHTDDAGLARAAGLTIRVVPGERANTKLTTEEDFAMAEATLAVPDVRVGHGYDTHRLTEGDHVWLCGLKILHTQSLDGHSDADVGLHALTDALLATVGAGDIGTHFPPSEERWRGAASDQFLAHACTLVRKSGGTITHSDVTLVCERPKIGPHVADMRARIGAIMDVDVGRISVKATTNEERGFVGREEGIVALATATVVFA